MKSEIKERATPTGMAFTNKIAQWPQQHKNTGWVRVGELLPERVTWAVEAGEIKRTGTPYYERQDFIEYWMAGWVNEYKRADAWIKNVERILPTIPPEPSDIFSLRRLYEGFLTHEKKNRAKAKRHITWLGRCHDQVTGKCRFTAVRDYPQNRLDKEAIRERSDLVDFIGGYTVLKRSGTNYRGLCPLHQEKTPSFYVNPEKGWYCHGCHRGGDIFNFVMEVENINFSEAVKRVGGRV